MSLETEKDHSTAPSTSGPSDFRIPPPTSDLLRRFLKKVQPEPNSGCWLWDGAWQPATGYGHMHVDGHLVGAHRLSMRWLKGLDPSGFVIRHRCHVRLCVNPEHLELGTHEENMRDMASAGRTRAKLTSAQVEELRRRRANGELLAVLAAEFGISEEAASAAANGRSYAHAPGPRTKTRSLPTGTTRTREERQAFIRSRVTVRDDGCWIWPGKPTAAGYGKYGDASAHRASYEAFVGPIPKGAQIDHRCRVRRCVNPDHLEVVTAQENLARRRMRTGEEHAGASLSDADVLAIRERFAQGRENAEQIAAAYGVKRSAVTSLVRGRRRLEAGGPTFAQNLPRWTRRRLSDADARAIRERYAAGGVTGLELATEYGVTDGVVESILCGRTYHTAGGPILTLRQKRALRFPPERVRDLREKAAAFPNVTIEDLAHEFGWSHDTVIKLLRHEKHPEAGGPRVVRQNERRGKPNEGNRKLTDVQAREIRLRYAAGGCTHDGLGREYGVSGATVKAVVTGKAYPTAGGPIAGGRHRTIKRPSA